MATYRKVSRLVPSAQRSARITGVVATDQIDIHEILGRSARQVKIVPDDASDTITFRLNNRVKVYSGRTDGGLPTVGFAEEIISQGAHHSLYSASGSTEYLTDEGLRIDFIEITSITFGAGGSSIEIIVW